MLILRMTRTEAATSNVRTPSTRPPSRTTLPALQPSDRLPLSQSPFRPQTVSFYLHAFCCSHYMLTNDLLVRPFPQNPPQTASASPAKPRTTSASKYDPTNGNRTVGPSGVMPRRSTTLYEKTSSTEKTNVLPPESKYVGRFLVVKIAFFWGGVQIMLNLCDYSALEL